MEEDSASMFPKKEREKPEEDEEATPPPSGGGWSGWGFSPFSVLSDLQKAATVAAEEISRNLPRLQQRALQICRMWPRTHKLLRRMIWKDLQLKEKTKMRMTSDVRLLWINWRRLVMIHSLARLEHSAVNLAESIQHGGLPAAGSVTLSLIESGIAITAKGMQVLELVGKETMDLLITETGINVENKEGQPQDDDDQFEEVTFDRCFYIYGGPEQLEELEALSNHYALLFNRRTGKLSSEQKSLYDGKLKLVRQIFSLGSEIDGSAIEAEKGKKIEVGVELGADEMKNLHDSSVSKAAEMAAGFANTLAGLPTNDIIQRTSGRLDSLHSEGVHRLSDMCCYATSQLMMLGKSIISNASKVQDTGVDEDALKIDWTEDSGEKAKIIRIRTQSMMGNVEAVCKSFMMGIAEVAEAYTAAVEDASVESQEVLPLKSIQEKANAFSENLRSDQTTATGKIQDGLQYLSYVVLSTSMPAA